jgi:hypothetical protein
MSKTKRYPTKVKVWKILGTCDPYMSSPATQKGHKHWHGTATKPSYTRPLRKATPAQFRRRHLGVVNPRKLAKKEERVN